MAFFHVVALEANTLSQSIAGISMVDDSAKSGMVKRARGERWKKRRWLPGGRWRTLLRPLPLSPSPFLLQFPILQSSTYIPADTARCSCFYHYCYYNFGGWTSDEPMRRLSGWERFKRNGEEDGERRRIPWQKGRKRQRERQEADAKDGPCGEDKMVKKRKKKWLPSEGGTARKEEGFHRGFRGWPPGNL